MLYLPNTIQRFNTAIQRKKTKIFLKYQEFANYYGKK